jgi:hypothetical protein
MVPSVATSHVPSPLTSATIAVTPSSRHGPSSPITAPIATNGSVFAIRWPKPACRKGANSTPSSPSTSRGSIP